MSSAFYKASAFGALFFALQACTNSDSAAPENRITLNDFENLEGWTLPNQSLNVEKAHSGRYSIKVDKDIEYGLGYMNTLSKVSPSRLQKLTLNLWAMRAGADAKSSVVVQIVDPIDMSKQAYWQSIDLSKEAKAVNSWMEIKKTFELPATLLPTQQLRVYLWRTGGSQATYIDDVELVRE